MDRMRDYLTAMCAGWDVQQIRDIVTETLHEIIDPIVYDEAVELIEQHKSRGPRRRGGVVVGLRGRRPDLGDGRRRPQRGHDDGRTRRQVHRRDRLLRLRPVQGRGRSSPWPPSRTTTWPRATPTPTPSPICRCSKPWATRSSSIPTGPCARRRSRAAGPSWRSPTRSPARAAVRSDDPPHPVLTAGIAAAGTLSPAPPGTRTRRLG